MGLFSTASKVHARGSFIKNLYTIIIILFLVGILCIAINKSIEAKDPKAGFVFVGDLFLSPTLELHKTSNEIISNKVVFIDKGNLKDNIIYNFLLYDSLITSLMSIIIIITLLYKLASVLMGTLNPFGNFMIALGLFFVMNMLTIAILKNKDIFIPIYSFYDFFRCILFIVSSVINKFTSNVPTLNKSMNLT